MNTVPYAPLGKRFWGQLVDTVLPFLLVTPGFMALLAGASRPDGPTGLGAVVTWVGLVAVLVLGVVQWHGVATRGQSIGKRVTGTRIVDAVTGEPIGWGRALLRHVVLTVMGNLCGIPLLVQLFIIPGHPRRQGWHDAAARSVVLLGSQAQTQAAVADAASTAQDEDEDAVSPVVSVPPPPSLATGAAAAAGPPRSAPTAVSPTVAPVPPPPVAPLLVSPPPGSTTETDAAHPEQVEHTVLVDRPTPRAAAAAPVSPTPTAWRLVGDDGTRIDVVTAVVVGRDPNPDLVADAETVSIDDPQRTMSKTHAVLRVSAHGLTVEDLASTNGVHLVGSGSETRLPVRTATPLPPGQRLTFGDRAFVVERDG